MPKSVIVLGSTGSIGVNTLAVAQGHPAEFRISGLAAASRWETLTEQALKHKADALAIPDTQIAERAGKRLREKGVGTTIFTGPDALVRMVEQVDCDFVMAAVVGVAGLPPTLAALQKGVTVGLANKEALVVAGELMIKAAKQNNALLIPVDSEHSAIFQSLHSGRHEEIERLLLTASGGPFRTWSMDQMTRARPADALRHPTWDMGPKITIDSATMMNKALEIIEARWLFDVDPDRIEVVIHPESIIHSMVAFRDGSIVAQMGSPDMRTPIQYAMTYPRRLEGTATRLDFSQLDRMTFEPPDEARFPALRLGQRVARVGGTAGAALNAANEAAVAAFRDEKIGFLDIAARVEEVLERHSYDAHPTMEQLMQVDAWARREIMECCAA